MGDFEGHPFRGNQYAVGGGGAETNSQRYRTSAVGMFGIGAGQHYVGQFGIAVMWF